ncbi:hypothetical protein D3C77_432020 [compost metagenome]
MCPPIGTASSLFRASLLMRPSRISPRVSYPMSELSSISASASASIPVTVTDSGADSDSNLDFADMGKSVLSS